MVSWLAASEQADVDAAWDGPGSPWHQRLNDPLLLGAVRSYLKPAAAAAAPAPVTVEDAPADEKHGAHVDDADQPVRGGSVSLTPLPPLISFDGSAGRWARSAIADFTGEFGVSPAPVSGGKLPTGNKLGSALVGQQLPQSRFLLDGGDVVDLAQSRRHTLLVIMRGFSGTVCLYCATQTAAIANEMERFAAADVDLLVLFPGPEDTIMAFLDAVGQLRAEQLPLRVALDVNQILVRGLGVEGELARPTSLLVNPEGTIVWAYVGSDMDDRPSVADYLDVIMAHHRPAP